MVISLIKFYIAKHPFPVTVEVTDGILEQYSEDLDVVTNSDESVNFSISSSSASMSTLLPRIMFVNSTKRVTKSTTVSTKRPKRRPARKSYVTNPNVQYGYFGNALVERVRMDSTSVNRKDTVGPISADRLLNKVYRFVRKPREDASEEDEGDSLNNNYESMPRTQEPVDLTEYKKVHPRYKNPINEKYLKTMVHI